MDFIKQQQWRYATKQFDPNQRISSTDLNYIKQGIQLSASSYGLQLYKVVQIEAIDLRQKLRKAAYDQPQVTDADRLFVFCRYAEVSPEHIDQYLSLKAAQHAIPVESTKEYGDQIKSSVIHNLSPQERDIWMSKQVYIALANAISSCAVLQIDAAPMEGFDPAAFDRLLNLEDKGLKSTVLLAMGYRSPNDATQHLPKVRKPFDLLFETV
ncbi:MAG: NAD(P)H-dependent oxidoreductase [Flavobacteriaceae bacterium]